MLKRANLISCTALVSLAFLTAAPAFAGSFTVTAGPTVTTAETLTAGQSGTINAGGTLSTGTRVAITWAPPASGPLGAITITNNGTVTSTTKDAIQPGGGSTTIINNGSITSAAGAGKRAINLNYTGTLSDIGSISITNGNHATIQSDGDAIRVTASDLSTSATGSISVDNAGTIQSVGTGSNNGQAIDFNDLKTSSSTYTVTNESTGIIKAADADAIRIGQNGTVNNYGQILGQNLVAGDSGNDGVDVQKNTGVTINNYGGGSIEGSTAGIAGGLKLSDGDLASTVFTTTVNNAANGIIKGDNGSGINLDGIGANQTATIVNHGTITGKGVTGDGDGIDVDGPASITNTGLIQSLNSVPDDGDTVGFSEGITVGGGTITNSGTIEGSVTAGNTAAVGRGISLVGNDITNNGIDTGQRDGIYANAVVTNQAGGLIKGDTDSGIYVGGQASGFTTTINNNAQATIQGGGTSVAAIVTGVDNVTINNAGTIDGSSSGKAIALGAGNDTVNLSTGSNIIGTVDGGAGNNTLNLTGTGSLRDSTNFQTLNINGGNWALTGTEQYGNGNLTNGSVLKTDPTTIDFATLTIDGSSILQASSGDIYRIGGDLLNHSTQNTTWDTTGAELEFAGNADTTHTMLVTGADDGRGTAGLTDNFAWNTLAIDSGNILSLASGLVGGNAVAFYVNTLVGFDIQGGIVDNVIGNGINIYYDALTNPNLWSRTYNLENGGQLIAYNPVPAPASLLLLVSGLGLLGARRRRRSV